MIKIEFEELRSVLLDKLLLKGMVSEDAEVCAQLFATATLDGVSSHGINRFKLYCDLIDGEVIQLNAQPSLTQSIGAIEQWDGHRGSGPNNAYKAVLRAVDLAKEHGIACVALANTNHWMRGGNYGRIAAKHGKICICWSNTTPNMPLWGGAESRVGNNPLIIAVPHEPDPIVLDMSMSLYSYGKMETYEREGRLLPYDGGFDKDGQLTKEPTDILHSGLPLPIGLWKGAGLSMMLDLVGAIISGGQTTADIGQEKVETGVTQIFICIDPARLHSSDQIQGIAEQMMVYIKESPTIAGQQVRYPGEGSQQIRERQLREGIQIDENVWREILEIK